MEETIAPVARELADELLPCADALARELTAYLVAAMPELGQAADRLVVAELQSSVEANLAQVMRLLRLGADAGAVVVPPEAADFMRGLVRRGIALPVLLRTYRLGHAWFWERWTQALDERVADPGERLASQDETAAFLFAYIDRVSDMLVEQYGSERERVMRGAAQLRAETVHAILGGEVVDEEVAAARLGYELRREHVALRVSATGSEIRGLERAAEEAASALRARGALIVPSGVATLDVWCAGHETPSVEGLAVYSPPDGIRIAWGGPAPGVDGFRRSHAEAVEADHVVALAGARANVVTSYRDVELVSLLASDLPRARAFVAAQLGALAALDEAVERLRETLLAFLAAGGSSTRVAKDLFVHQNTVAYRVKRAEELLGRRVTERPVELICALTLAAMLGPAVLRAQP